MCRYRNEYLSSEMFDDAKPEKHESEDEATKSAVDYFRRALMRKSRNVTTNDVICREADGSELKTIERAMGQK